MLWMMIHDPENLPDGHEEDYGPIDNTTPGALIFALLFACPSFIGTSDPSLDI